MIERYYLAGTDTDVGKTAVAALLARDLVEVCGAATVVKIAQTGIAAGEPGDAQVAAAAAGCTAVELARFARPADPWSAARAERRRPLGAAALARRIAALAGPLVVEGSGGVAVPLGPRENISDVARLARLPAVLVVGVRLGCINHAVLSLEYLKRHRIRALGMVLSVRWPDTSDAYVEEVTRALRNYGRVVSILPYRAGAPALDLRGAPNLLRALRA